ncbi:MAG TPA: hypothetical protein VGL02_19225 [Streptomyces sp.]
MTYEQRVLVDFAFGQLETTGGINATATAMKSAGFAGKIPTSGLSTTRYVPITLIDEISGVYETVWITGFVSATNIATIVRAREGSTARTWPQGTTWVHAPTIRDGLPSLTRATLPADPHTGMRAALTDENAALVRTYANGWLPLAGPGAPQHQGTNQYGTGPSAQHALEVRCGYKSATSDGSGYGFFNWSTAFTTGILSVSLTNLQPGLFGGWYVVSDVDKNGISYQLQQPGGSGGVVSPVTTAHKLYYIAIGW